MESINVNIEKLMDLNNITLGLMSNKAYEEKTEKHNVDIVARDFFDMKIILQVVDVIENTNRMSRAVMARKTVTDLNKTEQELFDIAKKNTSRVGNIVLYDITSHLLAQIDGKPINHYLKDKIKTKEMMMLTNKDSAFGAGILLCGDVLNNIRNKLGCDFYIIPSSIHELIILPLTQNIETKDVINVVKKLTHDSAVTPEQEYLSDKLFIYQGETKTIEQAI